MEKSSPCTPSKNLLKKKTGCHGNDDSLFFFIIKAGCWAFLHLFIMWFLMMNKYEKDLVKDFLGKILGKIFKKKDRLDNQ